MTLAFLGITLLYLMLFERQMVVLLSQIYLATRRNTVVSFLIHNKQIILVIFHYKFSLNENSQKNVILRLKLGKVLGILPASSENIGRFGVFWLMAALQWNKILKRRYLHVLNAKCVLLIMGEITSISFRFKLNEYRYA